MSQGQDPLDIDIDQLLRESARAAAEYDSSENQESNQQDLQDRQALRRVAGLSPNYKMSMTRNIANYV